MVQLDNSENLPRSTFEGKRFGFPTDECIHNIVEQRVLEKPDAVAVMFGNASLTYHELNSRANQLAHCLRELHVAPDECVAISMPRSLNMVVAVLAVLKAGAAYLPLDPQYPENRLIFMLENSGARVLLTHSSIGIFQGRFGGTTLRADVDFGRWRGYPDANLAGVATGPDHLAYVIYTSGSTGQPKGVAMPHRPLVNLLYWQMADSAMGAGSRTIQSTSLSFDVSFQEIFATWSTGGTLVMLSEAQRLDPAALWELLARERIARLFLPFVALQQLADAAALSSSVPQDLREIITAGEQLQVTARIVEMFERLQNCSLHNHYGPTESHVVTAHTMRGSPRAWPALPPVGLPIANTTIRLLGEDRRPVREGETGEVYIGGACLARGYLGRPDLTADRFQEFSASGGTTVRLYKTGDLARRGEDGTIEFLGRADHQVKIRGFRIELGEIETVLHSHPDIAGCAVVAWEDQPGMKRLVAYLEPRTETLPAAAVLEAHVRAHLPEYMMPSVFLPVKRLPLTPSGKVDRNALPALQTVRVQQSPAAMVAPRHTIEMELAAIWQRLLNLSQVDINTPFLAVGGNSILAVKMGNEIRARMDRSVPLPFLLGSPTIASIAHRLVAAGGSPEEPPQMRSCGAATPFFHIPGIDGVGLLPEALATLFQGQRPYFDRLQYPGMDGTELPLDRVEDIAAAMVRQIQRVRPSGPYILNGYCFGGLVAHEVALQLQAQGEEIESLVLWDAEPAKRYCPRKWRDVVALASTRLRQTPLDLLVKQAVTRTGWAVRHALRVAARTLGFGPALVPGTRRAGAKDPTEAVLAASYRAFHAYQPRAYCGAMALFFSRPGPDERLFKERIPWRGWNGLLPDSVRVYDFDCDHHSLLREPTVQAVAQETVSCLAASGQPVEAAEWRESGLATTPALWQSDKYVSLTTFVLSLAQYVE